MKAFTSLLALGVALLAAPAAPAQQEPPEGRFGEELTVSEVLLDVVVTDRQGNVIVGLTPEDFVVKEGGEPIQLESATFYSNRRLLDEPSTLGEAAPAVDVVPAPRYFVLFFHEQQRAAADNPELRLIQRQLEAAREARRWVEEERLLDDYVAVASYDVKLKVHQDFTRDEAALVRGINSATTGKDPGANWPSRIPETEGPSLRAGLPSGKDLAKKTRTVYEGLSTLAEAAGKTLGRKNLVLFSTGFGETAGFGLYRPDPRYYPDMVQALNDNNLAVYSVDLVPTHVVEHTFSSALNQLADETGGQYFQNVVNFLTPLKQVASETSGYYLLSYEARHPRGEKGYQKVTVATRNPEFRVRAREGYVFGA